MLLSGARLNADEALTAGLVDDITNDLERGARALADRIMQRSWRSLELAKTALRRPAGTTFDIVMQGNVENASVIDAARRAVSDLRPDVPPRFRTIEIEQYRPPTPNYT